MAIGYLPRLNETITAPNSSNASKIGSQRRAGIVSGKGPTARTLLMDLLLPIVENVSDIFLGDLHLHE